MQVVHKDEDEGDGSRGVDSVDVIICVRKISRCLEGECLREVERRRIGIQISGEFLAAIKKELREGEEELVKVEELKRLEQEEKTMEEFI